jgi:hypothetical protein
MEWKSVKTFFVLSIFVLSVAPTGYAENTDEYMVIPDLLYEFHNNHGWFSHKDITEIKKITVKEDQIFSVNEPVVKFFDLTTIIKVRYNKAYLQFNHKEYNKSTNFTLLRYYKPLKKGDTQITVLDKGLFVSRKIIYNITII